MKKEWLKIVEPLVLISWCPQCKKVLREYSNDVIIQNLFEDDITHRSESQETFKHTPFLMVRVTD